MLDFLKNNLIPEIVTTIIVTVLGAILVVLRRKGVNLFAPIAGRKNAVLFAVPAQDSLQTRLLSDFQQASDVRILVIRGLAILGLKDSLFQKLLAAKNQSSFRMRVLLLDPKSRYAKIRASEISEGESAMPGGIAYSIKELTEIKQRAGLNIEVRKYDTLPVWRYIFCDQKLFVSCYLAGKDGYHTAMHVLQKTTASHYEAHERYFEHLWEQGAPVNQSDIVTHDVAIQLLKDFGCSDALIFHCKTVARVANEIAINAARDHKEIDLNLIELGALLHDIGKGRSQNVDHAFIGADFIRAASNAIPENKTRHLLARIVERHVGAGLTAADIAQLNRKHKLKMPQRDCVPETLEEIVVAMADKLVEGNHERTFDEQLKEKIAKFGADSPMVKRMQAWHEKLNPYIK